MNNKTFAELGLPAHLVKTLERNGFTEPKPIQVQAIPQQLQGRDILGVAQTGSGKTAAFGLPIVADLADAPGHPEPKAVRALILAPTRELAVQIEEAIRSFSRGTRLTTAIVLGGVSRRAQINKLARGVDILVATPGRLKDLMSERAVRLDTVRYLVLDEADRMLDMGFIRDVRHIVKATGSGRRTAMFSATMAAEVSELANALLNNPVRVDIAPQGTTVAEIRQEVMPTPNAAKRDRLRSCLADQALSRVIVFTRTKRSADRVAGNLAKDGFSVVAIHGNKSQNARQSALRGFRQGNVRVLVATDIAARGIDVPDVSHVINYELPDEPDAYVHRIGRTGRNGAAGVALTFCDPNERAKLKAIERLIRRSLPVAAGDHSAPIELPEGATMSRRERPVANHDPLAVAKTGQKKPRWTSKDRAKRARGRDSRSGAAAAA